MRDYILMPKTLTAENGAKAALMGEFKISKTLTCPICEGDDEVDEYGDKCEYCEGKGEIEIVEFIDWDTIKKIYKKAVEVCEVKSWK